MKIQHCTNLFTTIQIFVALFLTTLSTSGAQYYVRTDGNDSNSGTANSAAGAWKTLSKANQIAKPGDTIIIGPGEWREGRVTTLRDGTPQAPIIWQGTSNTETKISTTAWLPYSFIVKHDHIHFKSIRFVNSSLNVYYGADNGLVESCIFQQPNHSHMYFEGGTETHMKEWVVRNCEFRDASDLISAQACIRLTGSNHLFENNYFTSAIGGSDVFHYLGKGTIIRRNTFENWGVRAGSRNHVDLVQSFTTNPANVAEDLLFEQNFCRNMNGVQFGNVTDKALTGRVRNWMFRNNIFHRLSNTMNLYAPGFRFYNNTFSYCYGSAGQIMFNGSTDRGRASTGFFSNNIFYKCGVNPASRDQGWPSNNASAGQISASHNLVIGIGAGRVKDTTGRWTRYGMLGNSLNGVEPLFVGDEAINAGNATTLVTVDDFKLKPNSPVIGMGINLSQFVANDFNGDLRPTSGPWDIGAYNYSVNSQPADTTPPVLSTAGIDPTGKQLTLVFNENVFAVNANHYNLSSGQTLSNVVITNDTVTMTVAPAVQIGTVVTLNYTSGTGRTADSSGNLLQSFSGFSVVNNSLDQTFGVPSRPRNIRKLIQR